MVAVTVLVVDDQTAFLRAVVAVVEETSGFRVVGVAASGEESLVVAAAVCPELVLMDVNLPGMDGLEAARRLLASVHTIVVLLSTYDEDVGERFVIDSGAAAYVTKSAFGPDRLRAVWTAATHPRG
jgi:DNA-binding NarL/FixJ family response regulator